MDIRTFKVEQWMNEYETNCKYNLAETCIDSLTIRELIELAGLDVSDYMNALADTRLTYSDMNGRLPDDVIAFIPLPRWKA